MKLSASELEEVLLAREELVPATIAKLRAHIAALEAERTASEKHDAEEYENLQACYDAKVEQLERAEAELREMREALEEIRDTPKCIDSCAAFVIARAALAALARLEKLSDEK